MTRPHDNFVEYVLGTLEPSEVEQVEALLMRSAGARAEVRQLRDSLVTLTESLPPMAPRAEVWSNLQARLATEHILMDAGPSPIVPPSVRVLTPRGWPSRTSQLGWQVAACFCVIAIGSLFWGSRSYSAYQQVAAEALLVTAFLAEPQVQKITLHDPGNQGIGGVLREPQGRALFVLDQAPAAGRAYQAWGHTSDDWEPGSSKQLVSLKVSQDKVFEVPTQAFASLYLSLEPARGSPQPTQPLSRVSLLEPVAARPLEITSPTEGATLTAASVIVSGLLDSGATDLSYTLNDGNLVQTSVAGNRFTFTVTGFQAGPNTIQVRALLGGNTVAVDDVTVTYTPDR